MQIENLQIHELRIDHGQSYYFMGLIMVDFKLLRMSLRLKLPSLMGKLNSGCSKKKDMEKGSLQETLKKLGLLV